jgi:hypothetical protein
MQKLIRKIINQMRHDMGAARLPGKPEVIGR